MLDGTGWRKDAEELMLRYLRVLNHHYEGLEKNLNSNLFLGKQLQPRTKLLRRFHVFFNFTPCNHLVETEQSRPPPNLLCNVVLALQLTCAFLCYRK